METIATEFNLHFRKTAENIAFDIELTIDTNTEDFGTERVVNITESETNNVWFHFGSFYTDHQKEAVAYIMSFLDKRYKQPNAENEIKQTIAFLIKRKEELEN